MANQVDEQLTALAEGRAFARLPLRVVRVAGSDAIGWLHDLLTADIAGLTPGSACRTLLLTPTGRIRADAWAIRTGDGVVLAQPQDGGDAIESLLAPYVLSSRVDIGHEPDAIVAVPETTVHDGSRPSWIGVGKDVLVAEDDVNDLVASLRDRDLIEASPDALERWRILRGVPRFGADLDTSTLPSEAGLDDAIALDKGCYLGQESVARVRNLGHPPTVLRHVRVRGALETGDAVLDGVEPCGTVTSACPDRGGSVALVRIAWASRDGDLATADGRRLDDLRGPA